MGPGLNGEDPDAGLEPAALTACSPHCERQVFQLGEVSTDARRCHQRGEDPRVALGSHCMGRLQISLRGHLGVSLRGGWREALGARAAAGGAVASAAHHEGAWLVGTRGRGFAERGGVAGGGEGAVLRKGGAGRGARGRWGVRGARGAGGGSSRRRRRGVPARGPGPQCRSPFRLLAGPGPERGGGAPAPALPEEPEARAPGPPDMVGHLHLQDMEDGPKAQGREGLLDSPDSGLPPSPSPSPPFYALAPGTLDARTGGAGVSSEPPGAGQARAVRTRRRATAGTRCGWARAARRPPHPDGSYRGPDWLPPPSLSRPRWPRDSHARQVGTRAEVTCRPPPCRGASLQSGSSDVKITGGCGAGCGQCLGLTKLVAW